MIEPNQFNILIEDIVAAVQADIATVPDWECGAIHLLIVPKCDEARRFIGGPAGNPEIEFTFPAKPGFSHTRPAGWRGDPDECDCAGYAKLKTQGTAYAFKHGYGYRSRDMPDSAVTWGRENDAGGIVFVIKHQVGETALMGQVVRVPPKTTDFMRIYVSSSGADSLEDESASMSAKAPLDAWCSKYSSISTVANIRSHYYVVTHGSEYGNR